MKHPIKSIRSDLEEFLRGKHGVEIIYDRGPFHGGVARIYEDKKLLLNRFIPDEEKASIMARAVIDAKYPLDDLKDNTLEFVKRFKS
ncbi:MAG: hypothetical protein KAI81_04185 [Candidatus Marinimicrobia bacterium]|nr:hypothetical protein [Candidatus Neomarinimicrobiota bacterium]